MARSSQRSQPDDLAKRLRRWRRLCDLSQVEVSDTLGVSQPTVAEWENGRSQPRPAHYERLVALFAKRMPAELKALPAEMAALEEGIPPKKRQFTAEWAAQLAKARERLREPKVREKMREVRRPRDSNTGRYTKRKAPPEK